MENKKIDCEHFNYFQKALEAFDFSSYTVMTTLFYYCDNRQNLGYSSRLYAAIWKQCNDEQRQYFRNYFKSYKKIPSFNYLWNWYFLHNTADQYFELKASIKLFNLLINDIVICNDLIATAPSPAYIICHPAPNISQARHHH